ncbi:hypothetical protein AMTR_s00047p00035210 [Amborella trichopoda]|uniref:Uncharacterized protein n=1 Tax=Amborella trichopoda TaxID=13333 RepID=U5D8H2_AMBTC|nr:hypothetical protein AMTR_s00047p00035210 [Amborella trichopoda]
MIRPLATLGNDDWKRTSWVLVRVRARPGSAQHRLARMLRARVHVFCPTQLSPVLFGGNVVGSGSSLSPDPA